MSLQELNILESTPLKKLLTKCCGSSQWVEKMTLLFPFESDEELFETATSNWYDCHTDDWLEAFAQHPKIGDTASLKEKFSTTADWAAGEQSGVEQTSRNVLEQLSDANMLYEKKFGYIFIVCATGKTANEILELLKIRLNNKPGDEIKIAMEEQNKITAIRLAKLLNS